MAGNTPPTPPYGKPAKRSIEVRLGPLIGLYIGDYRHQGETIPVLDAYYLAVLGGGEPTPDPAEMSEVGWFPLAAPPPLAFPTMDAVVRDARRLIAAGALGKAGGSPG
ncbi:MAG: NUDIX hydrolase [Micromonosporaceae bacterium]